MALIITSIKLINTSYCAHHGFATAHDLNTSHLPHVYLAPLLGVIPLFRQNLGVRKLESMGYRTELFALFYF